MAASCDNSFCNSYLLLRPQELGLLDLLRLLFSPSLQHLKFVDSSEEREERFERRWIIFISLLVQKLLLSVARPLSWAGLQIELWLNIVSINGGLGTLLLNFIRGRAVIMPEKISKEFASFIWNLDRRVDFDRNIRPGDKKYYAMLSVMSSKASYENEAFVRSMVTDHWKMEFLGLYDFWNEFLEKAATQAFVLRDKSQLDQDIIVVAFRGTECWTTLVGLKNP